MGLSFLGHIDDGALLLHTLLCLSSQDALKTGLCSRDSLQFILDGTVRGSGASGSRFWIVAQALNQSCKGSHAGGQLWLHGVANVPKIAEYATLAKEFDVLSGIRFRTAKELEDFCKLLECTLEMVHDRSRTSCFMGLLEFMPSDCSIVMESSGDGCLTSRPLRFCWFERNHVFLDFELRLRIDFQANRSHGLLSWSPRFLNETSDEERDIIHICVRGCLILADTNCKDVFHMIHSGTLNAEDETTKRRGSVDKTLVLDALRTNSPFFCTCDVKLSSMGTEARVIPFPGSRCWLLREESATLNWE